MHNEDLEIIPREKLGKYHLDWDIDTLIKNLPGHYTVEEGELDWYVKFDNYFIAINKFNNKIDRIEVDENFKEKFKNKIGCGSTLGEVEKECGGIDTLGYGIYFLDDYPGIRLFVTEVDEEAKNISRDLKLEGVGIDGPRLPPDTDYAIIRNTHYDCPFPKDKLKASPLDTDANITSVLDKSKGMGRME